MTARLAPIDRILGRTMRAIAVGCLAALFLLLMVNVAARSAGFSGFAWFDEIVQGLFAWMVFIGAGALWRDGAHFRVDWLESVLGPGRPRGLLRLLIALCCLSFLLAMTLWGWDLTSRSRALTPILDIPTGLFYLAIPVSGLVMSLYTLRDVRTALTELRS